jgi:hypothetical protein
LFIISSYSRIKNEDGTTNGIDITFVSLSDKLQESGRAIEQYVNFGAPGEGYAYPYIRYDNKGNKLIGLDAHRRSNYPITHWQVELQGVGVITNAFCMGRPCKSEEDLIVPAPRHLLGSELHPPISNPLNRTSQPTSNYFFIKDGQVQFNTQSNPADKSWTNFVFANEKLDNDGLIVVADKYDSTNNSNNY